MTHAAFDSYVTILIMAALLMAGAGCNAYHAHKAPDGSIDIDGVSLMTDKGIQRARIQGFGDIDGYQSNPNVEAMRAFGEGLGAGMAKGAKP